MKEKRVVEASIKAIIDENMNLAGLGSLHTEEKTFTEKLAGEITEFIANNFVPNEAIR